MWVWFFSSTTEANHIGITAKFLLKTHKQSLPSIIASQRLQKGLRDTVTGGSRRLTAILAQLLPSCAALGTRVPRSATRYTTWTLVNIDTFCQSSANNKFQSLPQPPVHKSLGCANLTTRNTRKLARTQVWTSLCGSIYKKWPREGLTLRTNGEKQWEKEKEEDGVGRNGGEKTWEGKVEQSHMWDFTFVLKCATISNELFVVLEKRCMDMLKKLWNCL